MRRLFVIAALTLSFPTMVMAGYHVSTEVQHRHAVLEEFTGIHCVYCPQGHKIAASILEQYPDLVEVISVHYGSYAESRYDDQPDFNTSAGNVIGNYFGPSSFPIGMVNRREYEGRVLTSRSIWEGQVESYIAETTPVNLWSASRYDVATGLLAIDVEGYVQYADNDSRNPLYLAVALTQDSILGPQAGGLMGDEYPHNHVLRDYLTPVWGEPLGPLSVGSYFTRHYEYQVPASYKNTDTDYRQLELITLLTNEKHEIVNATHCKPETSTWHVSSAPEPRHALIEDYTGVLCGNCPDGDVVVENVMLAQPELVHAISIHTGHYADPSSRALPDYRSEAGDSIADYYGPDAFPSGMVNRHDPNGMGVIVDRGSWVSLARNEAHTTAPVNLWMQSIYSAADRTLRIDVEGFALETSSYALSIALTQNHLVGYQAGGGDNMMAYDHNRVLRDYVTPVWGEPLGEVEAGTYFKRHYEYVLPEDYRGEAVVPENVELTGIVSDNNRNIVNCLANKPTSDDFALPLAFELQPYKVMPTRNWGFNFAEVYLLNLGNEEITAATFDVTLNEQTKQASWNGSIPGQTRGYVMLPVDWIQTQEEGRNEYEIAVTSVNGKPCSKQTVSGTFNSLINVEGNIVVKIKEDYFASDNRFLLRDTTGMVVYETGPFPDSTKQVTYVDTLYLQPSNIYCFEITDSWGNGIMTPRGNVKWYSESGSLLAQQLEFNSHGYRIFFRTAAKEPEAIEVLRSDAVDSGIRYEWHNGRLVIHNRLTGVKYGLDGAVLK